MTKIRIIEGGPVLLDAVGPLWKKLARHHAGISVYFAGEFKSMRWPHRRADLLEKARAGSLRIALAEPVGAQACVGYCVAVINSHGLGEIESLYVDDAFRGRGVGTALVDKIMAWFDRKKAESTSVNVAIGNESAFRFYRQWGFYPRVTSLLRKKKASPQRHGAHRE
jgi:ribosomal protein S18 acetylase RimI-like enzyme